MTRSLGTRVSLLAATAAAAFLFVPLAGANSSGLRVTELKGPVFPARTLVLSLPDSRSLRPHDVKVTEDGAPVTDFQLEPGRKAATRTFGVVLVRDTSLSMKGKPLQAALAAARAFAAKRNSNEELAVIDFNRTATPVLRFTTDESQITEALATTPKLAKGTRIYDAVARAQRMLHNEHINSGSIIVLSDGADTGSTTTLDEVAQRAVKQRSRIYTVGLDDDSYSPETLQALATAGNGEYVQAKAEALAPLFAHLGSVLSNEYLLSYNSLLGNGVLARVNVAVRGLGTAHTEYSTPLASTEPGGKSFGAKIVASPLTMVVFAVVFGAIIAVLVIGIAQPRRSRLPLRIAEFVSIQELQRGHSAAPTAAPPVVGQPAVQKDWWARFRETLEIARINVEPELLVGGTILATVLVFIFLLAVTGSMWWALLALVVPFISRDQVLRALKRQRSRFAEQLPEALQVIASALRSGHSFAGSLAVVVESASEPMRSELQRVVADEQLGIPIQRSLGVVADRMASTDVDQLALVAELQRQAGGDMAEVIDRVAETVRERFDLKRLVETLTTQGRMSRWIVTALPLVLLIFLKLLNPHYFHPLMASTAGRVVVIFAAAWAVAGSLVIKNIVEIEV